MKLQCTAINLGHIEHAFDNLMQTMSARLYAGNHLQLKGAAFDHRVIDKNLTGRLQDGQGRAQFVRGHLDKIRLGAVEALQLLVGARDRSYRRAFSNAMAAWLAKVLANVTSLSLKGCSVSRVIESCR